MLRSLRIIDDVVVTDEPTACSVILRIKPDFYCKGPDYRDLDKDVTGEIVNEKAAVEKHGGQLVFTDEPVFSSGELINKFFAEWTDEQKSTIEVVKDKGGILAVRKAVEEISKLKILICGEPILDIYRFVRPEGISSKSPSISARFVSEETYLGGSIAIKNHLAGFSKHVNLHAGTQTCKKIRYLSGSQRIFEVTEIDDRPKDNEFYCDKLKELSEKSDLVIAADFGHGLFEGKVLDVMTQLKPFVALNVQTNSSNYGFNVYTKHKRFDYLCLDTREIRLAEHDRWSDPIFLAGKTKGRNHPRSLSVTLGPDGAVYNGIFCPAFAGNVVDAIGAGDAYFAMTACLVKTGCHEELIPFIGNVFAGLKTKIIGNKSSVTKAQLIKACEGILK